jgi:hypothetical protein
MATNWGGQQTGKSTGPDLSKQFGQQQRQFDTGMQRSQAQFGQDAARMQTSQAQFNADFGNANRQFNTGGQQSQAQNSGWRQGGGQTGGQYGQGAMGQRQMQPGGVAPQGGGGIVNRGGQPQQQYPQMSGAQPTSKGGQPQYGQQQRGGISNIGGGAIGTNTRQYGQPQQQYPQMSGAQPQRYPQMSGAQPTSKGGQPQYNRDAIQQGQDWENQNTPQQQQLPPGATGTDGLNHPTYPQESDIGQTNNRPPGQYDTSMNGPTSGQGVGMTPGQPGHQGSQQDFYDPATGNLITANQQAAGWQAPFPGMTSGEGGAGGGNSWGMPFTQAEYAAMNPQQQQSANNFMATQMPYMQFGHNAYTDQRDFDASQGRWGAEFAQQQGNDAWNQQFADKQLGYGRQDAAQAQSNWQDQFGYETKMGDRVQDLSEQQAAWGQQNWGRDYDMRRNDQSFNQGMQTRQFGEDTRRYDQDFGEGARRFNVQSGQDAQRIQSDTQRWQGEQGIARQGQQNQVQQFDTTHREDVRRFDVGQGNVDRQFGEDTRRYDQGFGEDQRRYNQDFGEDARRYNQGFGEDQRRYNQDFGFKQSQFGEDTRRFDVGQGNWQAQFGEDTRRFDVGQGNWQSEFGEDSRRYNQDFGFKQTQFGEDTRRFDSSQAQQMQIEQMRLAQAERAANVAATGRALRPNARWLKQT